MNWQLLSPLLVTILVAITGWFSVHRLNTARDRVNKRRDLIVGYLIQAYRQLESCSNRAIGHHDSGPMESAISDIQLLGSAKQVHLAQKFVEEFATSGNASLDELLAELRQDLRLELGLEKLSQAVKYLRIVEGGKSNA